MTFCRSQSDRIDVYRLRCPFSHLWACSCGCSWRSSASCSASLTRRSVENIISSVPGASGTHFAQIPPFPPCTHCCQPPLRWSLWAQDARNLKQPRSDGAQTRGRDLRCLRVPPTREVQDDSSSASFLAGRRRTRYRGVRGNAGNDSHSCDRHNPADRAACQHRVLQRRQRAPVESLG